MDIDGSQFNLPSDFKMPGSHKPVADSEGVSTFAYGNEGYVTWRFAFTARPWKKEKVKKYRLDASDTVPVILFYRDKNNQVPIKLKRKMRHEDRVTRQGEPYLKAIPLTLEDLGLENASELDLWELPHGFDSEMFQVAFERWKERGAKPGTSIASWRADPGQINTLAALGIFTVDQFGELSEEEFKRMLGTLPQNAQVPLLELHDMAIAFVNAYAGRVDAQEFGDKLETLEASNSKLKESIEEKDAEIQRLLAKIKGTGSKRSGAKKKATKSDPEVEDGQIKGVV